MVDEDKLNQLIGKMLGDLGGAFSVPMVRMGDKLGLYKALDEKGPMTSSESAKETGIAERYSREWLSHQAASGYLDYDPASGKFAMTPEQAMVFANSDSPVYLQGAFDIAVALMENQAKVEPAFRTGKGSAGAIKPLAYSAPWDVFSDRAIRTTSSPPGCRR
jgi:hypothetical protein